MTRPYSMDLRERVVAAVAEGRSRRAVARLFRLGEATVPARRGAHLQKTYGPPRLQAFSAIQSGQSTPTYPVSEQCPGQDGDPRVLVLIKLPASSAIF